MADDEFLSFAYGSNMLSTRLKDRTPSATVHAVGYVEGHSLVFDKRSIDGSGKGNMRKTNSAADHLYGVVFSIKKSEKPALDDAEGLGNGYREETVSVVTPGGAMEAVAYVGTDLDAARKPYDWYKRLILAGAIENELPQAYIEGLRSIQSIPDPRPDRPTKRTAEAALEASGIVVE